MGRKSNIFVTLSPVERAALDARLKDPCQSYASVQAWLREKGHRVGVDGLTRYAVRAGLRESRPRRFLRIDRILAPEHRAQYLELIADARTTDGAAQSWLRERGYVVSRIQVSMHRGRHLDSLQTVRTAAQHADMIYRIAKESGVAGLSEAALVNLEQVLMQHFAKALNSEQLTSRELTEMSRSMSDVMKTRELAEAMRREFEEQKRKAAEEADKLARRGVSGKDIAARVKEILGA